MISYISYQNYVSVYQKFDVCLVMDQFQGVSSIGY